MWDWGEWIRTGVAVAALAVATRAQYVNHRLARQVAERSGRPWGAWVTVSRYASGARIDFVVASASEEVTISELCIAAIYRIPRVGRERPQVIRLWITDKDFTTFKIDGPSLPCRIQANDRAVWSIPKHPVPLGRGIQLTLTATTARNEEVRSEPKDFGTMDRSLHEDWLTYIGTFSNWYLEKEDRPESPPAEFWDWVDGSLGMNQTVKSEPKTLTSPPRSASHQRLWSGITKFRSRFVGAARPDSALQKSRDPDTG